MKLGPHLSVHAQGGYQFATDECGDNPQQTQTTPRTILDSGAKLVKRFAELTASSNGLRLRFTFENINYRQFNSSSWPIPDIQNGV